MARLWQTVRVFISSTFRDMHSERDWLVKRVFPALRERLEKYRVHLIDIDLRWGVTEQQAESGGALDVCLDQIDECRPFFLGLLGERYGWVPTELPERVTSKYGWIRHTTKKSITELEILYGVLNDPKMHDNSLFCFRNPAFIDSVPEPKRKDVRAEDGASADKLKALKAAIKQAQLPIRPFHYHCQYAGLKIDSRLLKTEFAEKPQDRQPLEEVAKDGLVDPIEYDRLNSDQRSVVDRIGTVQLAGLEAFGERVKEWLWESIRRKLNLSDEAPTMPTAAVDPIEKDEQKKKELEQKEEKEKEEEQDFHERFMESRLRVYVGREKINRALTKFADGDDTVACLVTGPSGAGKSAAMSKFMAMYRDSHPDALVIPHFVGASPSSTSLRLMLRQLCLALKQTFGFKDGVEQAPQNLIEQFNGFLGRVPTDRRVLIVFDALNQLDETDSVDQLHWLPREFPAHVKVIVSCIDDSGRDEPVLKELRKRTQAELPIEALTDDERLQIVREVPSLSAKTLDDRQVRLLLENPATQSPLFLLVALEELRGFGSFEQLNSRIQALPKDGDTITALFVQVFERLETEFGTDLTRDILTLLASARRGLSERELKELTQSHNRADDLFAILRQLRPYLQPRGELLDFFHRNLFKAVREIYLDNPEAEIAAHTRLGDYFAGQDYFLESLKAQRRRARRLPPTSRPVNVRKIDELLWQRLHSHDTTACACESLLTDLNYLEARNEAGQVFALATDFTQVINALSKDHPKHRILRLLDEALRRDIHFIARHSEDYPQGLFQSLWNSCWWYDCPDAEQYYLKPDTVWREPPPWSVNEPRLCDLVASWSALKKTIQPGLRWLSTGRPPAMHLGTAQRAVLRGHWDEVRSVSFSPDGRRIVSGSSDNSVQVWDANSGAQLFTDPVFYKFNGLHGHKGLVESVSFSPDSQRIVSGSHDKTMRVWDAASGKELRVLRGHEDWVMSVSFSPDGKRIVSGSADKTVRLWDADSGNELRVLRGHQKCVNSVSFSPDGQWIVSGSDDEDVRLWDAASGGELRILQGHYWSVNSVSFSLDGTRIVSGSADRTVRLWDAASGDELRILRGHQEWVSSVSFSPDGQRIVSGAGDHTICMWDTEGGADLRVLKGPEHSLNSLSFSPDGQRLVSGSADNTVAVWDAASGVELLTLSRHERSVTSVSFSPDSQRIGSGSADNTVRVWDAASGKELRVLRGHEDGVMSISFSPDGKRIVSGSSDKTVRLWDADSGNELRVLRGHQKCVNSVSFSPDGQRIVSGAGDRASRNEFEANHNVVQVWDADSGMELSVLRGHQHCVTSVSFSRDGRQIVSADDYSMRVWDVETGERVEEIAGQGDVAAIARLLSTRSSRIVGKALTTFVVGLPAFYVAWRLASLVPWLPNFVIEFFAFIVGGVLSDFVYGRIATRLLAGCQAIRTDGETLVESASNRNVLARFPFALDSLATAPGDTVWAGGVANSLCLLRLEGGERWTCGLKLFTRTRPRE